MRLLPMFHAIRGPVLAFPLLVGLLLTPAAALAEGERAAFDQSVAEVKKAYREIEAIWSEYQTADEARQAEINQELPTLLASTKTKVQAMTDTALAAFKADPGGDAEVTELLLSMVEHKMVGSAGGGGDQYESALPVIEALIDGGVDKPILPLWGGLAAVVTNQFDLADKYAEMVAAQTPDPGDSQEAQEAYGLAMRYLQERQAMRAKWEAEAKIREAEAAADDLPRVKMTTNKGDIVFEMFENEAPIAVANFITLVKDGFYDGIVFHRVLPRFMAQGGDPTGTGSGGPGHAIACECYEPDARKHFRGVLSMAHAGRDTGGSQFFLTFVPTDHLDGRHTVFGRVIEGMDVLGELQAMDPQQPAGQPDKIISAEVLRDRGHGYEYEKLPSRR